MSHHDNAALGENGKDQYFGQEPTNIMLLLCMMAFINQWVRANFESCSTILLEISKNCRDHGGTHKTI